MTGKDINDLVKNGLKLYEDQTENFRYVLTVKDDAKLKDDASYVVVFALGEIADLAEDAYTALEITPFDALSDYLTELGTFGKADIHW